MAQWKTSEILKLLKFSGVTVSVEPPGGDVDTEGVILGVSGERLYVRGFATRTSIKNPADTPIEMVEVSDGGDSRGGLNSDDPKVCSLYGKVCSKLRKKGYNVVPSMDEYF